MNNTIKLFSTLCLLSLIAFLTACDKENIDDDSTSPEPEFPIDTLFCDLDFELTLGMGGVALETITITNLSGGTPPFTYNWSTGEASTTIVAPTVGTYSVTVTDTNNCTFAQSVEVTLNMDSCDSLVLSIMAVDSIPGVKRLEPTITGATPPYTYLWSNGETTMNATVTSDDNYSLTVTDADSCTVVANIDVTIDNLCDSFAVEIMQSIDSLQLFVEITAGIAPFTYLWQDGDTIDIINVTMPSGTYSVTVIDANSCVAEDSIEF